jgi:23S rRNA pseudouridine2605 synthase
MTRNPTSEPGHGVDRASSPRRAAGAAEVPARAPERIAKVMARAGLCSRREAEAWIKAGRVAVNGVVIASPALNVSQFDEVMIDGRPLPARERTRLFLYHKPRGVLTTRVDPQRRPTVFDNIPADLPRLVAVGRLDFNSEGLLLLTNEGGLARVLELPSTGWLRRYRVRAHGSVGQDELDALAAGTVVDGICYGPIAATLDRPQGSNVWLTLAMREGKNREVRNVLGALGLKVNRLIRTSFGPFQLGDIPEGGIEEVKSRTLREQLGKRLVASASADFRSPVATQRDKAEPRPAEHAGPGDGRAWNKPRSADPAPRMDARRDPARIRRKRNQPTADEDAVHRARKRRRGRPPGPT